MPVGSGGARVSLVPVLHRPAHRRLTAVAVLGGLAAAILLEAAAGQSRLYSVHGDAGGDFCGFSHGGIGDVDRDGFGDFAVCVREADHNGPQSGTVRVFSGRTGGLLYERHGDRAWDMLGYALAAAGDVDGDGTPDFIVGAPRPSNTVHGRPSPLGPGSAVVLSGKDGRTLHTFVGDAVYDLFGIAVDGGGDVDGDGTPDLLVGAPQYENLAGAAGYVRVYSGRTGGELFTFRGGTLGEYLGFAAAFPGDVNGDGHADVLAGGPGDDRNGHNAGRVLLYSGKDGSVLRVLHGTGTGHNFGIAVDGPGDVDRDGRPDLLIGVHGDGTNGRNAGAAHLYSGRSGALLFTFLGDAAEHWFGVAVRGAGDLDGDGWLDLVVGTHQDGHSGYARTLSGRTGAVLFDLRSPLPLDHFGFSVSPAGDVDGDGHADILVGAHTAWVGDAFTGSAHLFSGRRLPLTSDVHQVGLGTGGTQELALDAGPAHAGATFLVLGSGSGTRPGLSFAGLALPLNLDGYLAHTLTSPNQAPLLRSLGRLDGNGRGVARFTLPAGTPPALVGLTLHHAGLLHDGARATLATNAIPVTLVR